CDPTVKLEALGGVATQVRRKLVKQVRLCHTPYVSARMDLEDTMTRIYWLNPVGTNEYDPLMVEALQREVDLDTEVVVDSLSEGPCHLEFHYYGALALPESIRRLQEAERDGFDAAVMGCFYDPALKEIRGVIVEMPVVFPAEACTYLAATMGDKFSILVGRQKWVPAMRDSVERYGLGGKLASFVTLDMGVQDFQRDHDV